MKFILELIFLGITRARVIGLRPEVLNVIRAPEFERNQMIDLAASRSLNSAVFLIHSVAHCFGHMPMVSRPSRDANVIGSHARQDIARGELSIRANCVRGVK